MINWIRVSLNRKIGSILVVSLSFLLIVIGYSIFQIRVINAELKEVSNVDLPLTQVITQVEMFQLQQHLDMERFRLLMGKNSKQNPIEPFANRQRNITLLLEHATQLIRRSLDNKAIQFKPEEYQRLLAEIQAFSEENQHFEKRLEDYIKKGTISDNAWKNLEFTATTLDQTIITILGQVNQLTQEATNYAQKHQQNFTLIESALGVCAFILSSLLAVYVVRIIRSRINNIHRQVEQLHTSLEQGTPIARPDNDYDTANDELGELEVDLKKMAARLSDEMASRKEVEQQLIELATKDRLTNAYNRHKWAEQIQLLINFSSQDKAFSIISLDVDHFKKINDSYGHQVGDSVLRRLADILQKDLKSPEMLFRMGGEEFILVSTKQTLEEVVHIAERLRDDIASYQEAGLPKFTVSMGITKYRLGETEASLMTRADEALYQSKANGRNCITSLA